MEELQQRKHEILKELRSIEPKTEMNEEIWNSLVSEFMEIVELERE